MDLAPSSTKGNREMHVSFDWEHSPGTMILDPIEYKVCLENIKSIFYEMSITLNWKVILKVSSKQFLMIYNT